MFEARLGQSSVLKKTIESIKELVNEANWCATAQERSVLAHALALAKCNVARCG